MATRLIDLVRGLGSPTIVLVGDFMLDRYIFGRANRVSPEAPVPVIHYQHEEWRLGGAGFVLVAMTTLGAKVRAVGMIGRDEAGQNVRRHVLESGADASGLVECNDRPTVTKMRLLGASQERTPQQMIRLDIESDLPCPPEVCSKLLDHALSRLEGADLLCLEDYNKGVLAPAVCRRLIEEARRRAIPVIIDPANLPDYGKYRGATALKLNRPEAERATGLTVRTPEQCAPAARKLLDELDLQAVVITLNDQGAYLATRDGTARLLESRARQVADATGAGDMVLATLSIAHCAGASWDQAVALANVAGGLEVEKLGCQPVTREEIIHDLLAEQRGQSGKERTLDQLLPELEHHRAAGRKIVFTNGCFDIVHLGHVKYFQFAKAQGDLLVVGVNTDASIRRLKGEKRPIVAEEDRIGVLEELESIDYLVRFDQDTPIDLIRAIRPDVLVKGADYTKTQVVGWDVVESYGGRVALAPLIDGRSTSTMIQRILEAYR